MHRRQFLTQASAALTLASMTQAEEASMPKGTADSCIFLWLGGGACHLDTWDPKRRGDGRREAGSFYDAIPTAIPRVMVCEHLRQSARVLDRAVLLRTVNHNVIDEHAAATNRMHTGRPISETVTYPSLGSLVSHELGQRSERVPAYVVIGYPNVTRGPGFLGARHGYVYLTETDVGPAGLTRPGDVDNTRQERREAMLARLREQYLRRNPGDQLVQNYATAAVEGFRMAGPEFMNVFDLRSESTDLRHRYGGEFGQRCLLARRLVQAGVRFVEVSFNLNFINGTGWDTHNEGQQNQHLLIQELDKALATLILDLERIGRLDRTLIVVGTEFGRPPEFDAGGGRGHQARAFSVVLAGGGLRTGQAIGQTDELAKNVAHRPVSVPDLFATILCTLGIDPRNELYAGDRPVPLTDNGQPVREVFW
jgi:hypothetical protein